MKIGQKVNQGFKSGEVVEIYPAKNHVDNNERIVIQWDGYIGTEIYTQNPIYQGEQKLEELN